MRLSKACAASRKRLLSRFSFVMWSSSFVSTWMTLRLCTIRVLIVFTAIYPSERTPKKATVAKAVF